MSPSSTVHGGQYDTEYVTFEYLLHAAFVGERISVVNLNQLVEHTRKWRVTANVKKCAVVVCNEDNENPESLIEVGKS